MIHNRHYMSQQDKLMCKSLRHLTRTFLQSKLRRLNFQCLLKIVQQGTLHMMCYQGYLLMFLEDIVSKKRWVLVASLGLLEIVRLGN
jgi:hypothetical protein